MPDIFTGHRIIPVITLETETQALPLAEALAAGGIKIMEITLRTEAGLQAIRKLRRALPDMVIGAGTVTDEGRLQQAVDAGAQFLVSPGLTETLAKAFPGAAVPCLPGVATISEAMQAKEWGFTQLKFFPAALNGGVEWLKNAASVLPELRFCPTGGVEASNAASYLKSPNVFAVGGSWLVPKEMLQKASWSEISSLAQAAVSL